MTDFKTIQKDYLNIEPLDKDKIFSFYKSHRNIFENDPPTDDDELRIHLWMLAEIGATYSYAEEHSTAIPILNMALHLYEKNVERLAIRLKEEKLYATAIWSQGYSLLGLKRYWKARRYFKRIEDLNTQNHTYNDTALLQICEWKIKNRIAIILGVVGLIILITKYSVEWFSPDNYVGILVYSGFIGGPLLITASLIYKTKTQASTTYYLHSK
ncbi:MAG: hypothetical protein JKY52_18355 [Flavobacteriales bacterium]|nr:hypothetical protein [Flavobacteriales bacterium]